MNKSVIERWSQSHSDRSPPCSSQVWGSHRCSGPIHPLSFHVTREPHILQGPWAHSPTCSAHPFRIISPGALSSPKLPLPQIIRSLFLLRSEMQTEKNTHFSHFPQYNTVSKHWYVPFRYYYLVLFSTRLINKHNLVPNFKDITGLIISFPPSSSAQPLRNLEVYTKKTAMTLQSSGPCAV